MRNESLYRQWRILHLIYGNSADGISLQNLADEFNVSKRTIRRDITNLSSVGFPVYDEVDKHRGKQVFYYIHPGYKIPEIQFSISEVMSMLLAYKTSNLQNEDESFKSALNKITATIPAEMRTFLNTAQHTILQDNSLRIVENEQNVQKIQFLQEAVSLKKQVIFSYVSAKKQTPEKRTVSPYAIKPYRSNFYLAGYCHLRKEIRVFALSRIADLKLSGANILKTDFDGGSFFGSGFGIFIDKPETAKLRFNKRVAYLIRERIFHENQKLNELNSGEIELEIPISGYQEIKGIILSYGKDVKVLEPAELKDEIKEEIIGMNKLYNFLI
jgi:predicted DNA-binding transcriptional regulator YafY